MYMSTKVIEKTCPKCGAIVRITITNGIWPQRDRETAECPVCDNLLYSENITGDIEVELISKGNS